MIAYSTQTGTRRNVAAIRENGWRFFLVPKGRWQAHGQPHAIDCGAWGAAMEYERGLRPTKHPPLRAYLRLLARHGASADFIVIPDIVQGGEESWLMTRYWLRRIRRDRRFRHVVLLISVQDGFEKKADLIRRMLGPRVGIFVGGSTEWKEGTMPMWCEMARARGAWAHVARVNSARRIRKCEEAGAHSFDGSSVAFYCETMPLLEKTRHERTLLGEIARRTPEAHDAR